MGRRPDGAAGDRPRSSPAMTRHVRNLAWVVVGLLVLALVASLVLEST